MAMALASAMAFGGSRTNAAQLAGVLGAHDPSNVMKDSSTYWYFATGQGIVSRYSTDKINWSAGQSVFSTVPAWTTQAVSGFTGDFWAPTVAYFNSQYYLYYAVSNFGTIDSAIGVATSPTLTNPTWTDLGKVVQSDAIGQTSATTDTTAFNAIDPSILVDTDGKVWMSFGSYSSGIVVTQINPATGKRMNTSTLSATLVANNAPGGGWGSSIEASSLIKKGSFYYLFVNYGGCCAGVSSTYNIRVGRSTSPTGPFVDQNGIDMRNGGGTLFLGDNGNKIGPGQFGYYTEAGQDYFSYHYYDGNANGAPTFDMRGLYWTSDGWPMTAAAGSNFLGVASANWSDVTNWSTGGVPNAAGMVATFSGNAASRYSVAVDGANKTVGTINFTGASSYTVGTTPGNTILMQAASGDAATINVSAGNHTIAAPLAASSALQVNVSTANALTISGRVTAPSLAKYGFGNLSLGGTDTFSGTVLAHQGTVDITGSVTASQFTSIGVTVGDSATMTLRGTGHYAANADFNVGDTGDGVTAANGTLNIAETASLTVNAAGGFYVGAGFFSNTQATGTVNQSGGTLTANANFDGGFVIGGRTSALAKGTYIMSGGTVNANTDVFVGGHGTGNVTQTGGTFNANIYLSIGRYPAATGTYTLSAGTLNQTSASAKLLVGEQGTGTLTVAGTGNVTLSAPLVIANSGNGTVNLNGGMITLPGVTAGTGTSTFNLNGGTLRAGASNATFMQGLTSAVVQGGGAVIDTQAFTVTISQPLLGSAGSVGLTKSGTGTLTLSETNTYSGNTTVTSGTLVVANVHALGTSGLAIGAAGTVQLQSALGQAVSIPSLSFAGTMGAWSGSLNLTNDKLIVEATTGRATALANLQSQAYSVLTSSTMASTFGIAVIDNSALAVPFASFGGSSVDANSILVAPELLGDSNADGHVDLSDLNTVLNNLGSSTMAWTSGNFDSASTVDLNDLNTVLNHLGTTNANASVDALGLAGVVAETPEPGTVGVLALGAVALFRRRRARRSIMPIRGWAERVR